MGNVSCHYRLCLSYHVPKRHGIIVTGRGGKSSFTPTKMVGRKSFSHAEGDANSFKVGLQIASTTLKEGGGK